MQFNSTSFMIFFPVVVAAYFVIPRKCRAVWLLVSSYYFYMSWNAKYAVLIGTSTLITYGCAILLEKYSDRSGIKKLISVLCICSNLGILAVFKYASFAIRTVDGLLEALGQAPTGFGIDLLLPVGISFYTFQAIGYFIDVYRGDIAAEKNLIKYALFVSFFPQLVAGPIERSKSLLTQIRDVSKINVWDAGRIASGAILMVWGFFLKMVIADRAAILVNNVFADYRMYGSTELILAGFGFEAQVYCDFLSYSLIAMGAARIMGFVLMENFNAPILARDTKEFWRRWHISLTTWFRDYVYIPLGGSRKGMGRKRINLMIVFLLSGLWHGASWGYIIWGGINGLYLILNDMTQKIRSDTAEKLKINTGCFSWTFLKVIVTNILFVFAIIFYRAVSVVDGANYIKRIFANPDPWALFDGTVYELGLSRTEMSILIVSLVVLLLVELIRYNKDMMIDKWLLTQNVWFEWLVIIALIAAIFVFGEYGFGFDAQQFVYFQF
ncbi:MAG: MBOAT family protein [Lachnospiraceae bacterium]|nr:MBOAT family protein [Lachnospiraceae bacterium]